MITSTACTRYLADLLWGRGGHSAADDYRIALYTSLAMLDADTQTYVSDGEVRAPGYTPGGQSLVGRRSSVEGKTVMVDWDDPAWPASTITARGALIYNASWQHAAVAVLDFGEDIVSQHGTFTVAFPPPTAETALLRMHNGG